MVAKLGIYVINVRTRLKSHYVNFGPSRKLDPVTQRAERVPKNHRRLYENRAEQPPPRGHENTPSTFLRLSNCSSYARSVVATPIHNASREAPGRARRLPVRKFHRPRTTSRCCCPCEKEQECCNHSGTAIRR